MYDFSGLLKLTQSCNELGSMMYSPLWAKPGRPQLAKTINSRCLLWAAMAQEQWLPAWVLMVEYLICFLLRSWTA